MALVCTLASSSEGNSALVSDGKTHLLVDAGLSRREISARLAGFDLTMGDVSAVLVTHEHSDHVSGLKALGLPVYAAPLTCASLDRAGVGLLHDVDSPFEVGGISVVPFFTPHDTPQSLGFLLGVSGTGVAFCTDLGHMTAGVLDILRRADYLLLEANYDVDLLKRGRYPAFLKDRILGRHGHLSNDASAAACVDCARAGTRRITLCHLSKDNNTPDAALGAVAYSLHTAGISIELDAAPRHGSGIPWRA